MTTVDYAMEPVSIALVTLGAAIVAAMAPIVSLVVSSHIRRREKREDYARQDAVAAQAAEAARLLLAAQAETTQQNVETQGKLNQIHTLVNSNLTREMQDRLAALKGQVYLTKELIRLNRSNHLEPDSETQSSLRNLEETVSNLETSLKERGNATDRADSE